MTRGQASESIAECQNIKVAIQRAETDINARDEDNRLLEKKIKEVDQKKKEQVEQINSMLVTLKL
jgi:hypothetical protein